MYHRLNSVLYSWVSNTTEIVENMPCFLSLWRFFSVGGTQHILQLFWTHPSLRPSLPLLKESNPEWSKAISRWPALSEMWAISLRWESHMMELSDTNFFWHTITKTVCLSRKLHCQHLCTWEVHADHSVHKKLWCLSLCIVHGNRKTILDLSFGSVRLTIISARSGVRWRAKLHFPYIYMSH